ncbi:MAG: hypothetical protein ACXWKR_09070, partial [Phenylobacterium sp.]
MHVISRTAPTGKSEFPAEIDRRFGRNGRAGLFKKFRRNGDTLGKFLDLHRADAAEARGRDPFAALVRVEF